MLMRSVSGNHQLPVAGVPHVDTDTTMPVHLGQLEGLARGLRPAENRLPLNRRVADHDHVADDRLQLLGHDLARGVVLRAVRAVHGQLLRALEGVGKLVIAEFVTCSHMLPSFMLRMYCS